MSSKSLSKRLVRLIDATLGKLLRHFLFSLFRFYYSLFYNVSCSNKEKLQDLGGAIILSNHVSRHDGQLILSELYSVTRIRPTAYYKEFEHWVQHYPMVLFGTISMSSPRSWSPERREAQKFKTLDIMKRVLANGNSILIFPSGGIRKGEKEQIKPYLTGAFETIEANPKRPVVLIKIDGLGKYQYQKHDLFWSFIGRTKGRRHAKLDIEIVDTIPVDKGVEDFNKVLENYFNGKPLPKTRKTASKSRSAGN